MSASLSPSKISIEPIGVLRSSVEHRAADLHPGAEILEKGEMRRAVPQALFDALRPIDAGGDKEHDRASADPARLTRAGSRCQGARTRLLVRHSGRRRLSFGKQTPRRRAAWPVDLAALRLRFRQLSLTAISFEDTAVAHVSLVRNLSDRRQSLTAGFCRAGPSRRRFLAYAASAGASTMPVMRGALAAEGADVIFRNGAIHPDDGRPGHGRSAGDRRRADSRGRIGLGPFGPRRPRDPNRRPSGPRPVPGVHRPASSHHSVRAAWRPPDRHRLRKVSEARRRARCAQGRGGEAPAGRVDRSGLLRQSPARRRSVDGGAGRGLGAAPDFRPVRERTRRRRRHDGFRARRDPGRRRRTAGRRPLRPRARRQAERPDVRGARAASLPRRRRAEDDAGADRESAQQLHETGGGRRQDDAARARHRQAGMGGGAGEALEHASPCG